jgi:hypothetical protein
MRAVDRLHLDLISPGWVFSRIASLLGLSVRPVTLRPRASRCAKIPAPGENHFKVKTV